MRPMATIADSTMGGVCLELLLVEAALHETLKVCPIVREVKRPAYKLRLGVEKL